MTEAITNAFVDHPEVTALLVLVAGVALGRVLSVWVAGLAATLDRRLARYATGETLLGTAKWIGVVKSMVFWVSVLFAVLIALRLIGVGGLAGALDALIRRIPSLVLGLLIMGTGHLLGTTAANLLSRANLVAADSFAPRVVYGSVLAVAIVMGLQQMGIDTTFLSQLALVLLVVSLGGLALAFALGARQHVANLIAGAELQRYRVGQHIRVGSLEGVIVEIRQTGIDLQSSAGRVAVPAAVFTRREVVSLDGGLADE